MTALVWLALMGLAWGLTGGGALGGLAVIAVILCMLALAR